MSTTPPKHRTLNRYSKNKLSRKKQLEIARKRQLENARKCEKSLKRPISEIILQSDHGDSSESDSIIIYDVTTEKPQQSRSAIKLGLMATSVRQDDQPPSEGRKFIFKFDYPNNGYNDYIINYVLRLVTRRNSQSIKCSSLGPI